MAFFLPSCFLSPGQPYLPSLRLPSRLLVVLSFGNCASPLHSGRLGSTVEASSCLALHLVMTMKVQVAQVCRALAGLRAHVTRPRAQDSGRWTPVSNLWTSVSATCKEYKEGAYSLVSSKILVVPVFLCRLAKSNYNSIESVRVAIRGRKWRIK